MATEEPGHKAMLYFLEVLMNSNGPLTISQLAGRFGSRSFSPEMRSAAGKSHQVSGAKYPTQKKKKKKKDLEVYNQKLKHTDVKSSIFFF